MFGFIKRSIAAKLILVTAATITLLLALSNYVLISQTNDRVRSLVMKQAGSEASGIAKDIAADVGELSSAARTMAGVIGHTHAGGLLDRKGTIDILRANLEQNPFAFGSWFAEAQNAFDGKQADMKDKPEFGGNKTGQFSPYWSKDRNGAIQFSTFDIDYAKEWYALAAQSMKGAITKPYMADGTDVPTVMSSIAYPVISNGKLIGVSGVDISLASLSTRLAALRPFDNGRVMLVSQDGKWLVGPDASAMMKDYNGVAPEKIKAAIAEKAVSELDGIAGADGAHYDRLVYPFDLPGLNARWVVLVDIPTAVVATQVREQTLLMVVGGVVVLLAVIIGLYLSVRSLVQRPIDGLVADVQRLSRGQYDKPVAGQDSADETGHVAAALEGFRHKLADAVRLEAAAEEQRDAADAARRQNEQERLANAALQQQVVTHLGQGLSELSSGNLTYRLPANFPAEYGQLKNDFDSALASLEETIQTLHHSVRNISGGAGEISSASSDLSLRTEKQAASLEETAAALDELTTQVNSSADNAGRAARSVEAANANADKSGEIVHKAISAMHGIEQSSQDINRIIGVIDEIAFQTNLLALNAGVEAARAGEAGKGFAVVAQEVRELAQRSATAAKEIKALLNASESQVTEGVGLVNKAGEALASIATQVLQINGLIQEISSSSTEQAVGLREINAAVNQMDQVTQQNAAMVEEATAASAALNAEVGVLMSLVNRFRTSASSAQAAAPARAYGQQQARAPQVRTAPAPARRAPAVSGNTALASSDWEEF
ncbi:methyl-accepting chemotaxis sensory transducer with Cache sensor [Ensifer adhaerens]|nr:methyl-accepting chemotaxis sensory transducer with Cache sensor [Ensifer adhaerens]